MLTDNARESEMRQNELKFIEPSLFEKLCSRETLTASFKATKKNRGAPGIDGVSVEAFAIRLDEELSQLQKDLESWTYKPMPVRRVEIPKPTGGVRLLGIPTVRDRVVQGAIKGLLEPILDPLFSEHSYGFRPGRNQHQAIQAAQKIVCGGKRYVVDIDLSKFFDRIHHDRLISRLSIFVGDKRIIRLIGESLRSGIMKDGLISSTNEGAVQGSPLSPLLSNLVLDELDKFLEGRKIEFCRFADDCNAFAKTKAEAQKIMQFTRIFIECKLKLVVNEEKSKVAISKNVKFLGFTIDSRAEIAVSISSMKSAALKVKALTPRGTHLSIEKSIQQINLWYVGWSNYYSHTAYPKQLGHIEAHIRRRLRARLVKQQKRRRHLATKLCKLGVPKKSAYKTAYSNKGPWALSASNAVEKAYSNKWFQQQGLIVVTTKRRGHWHEFNKRPSMGLK